MTSPTLLTSHVKHIYQQCEKIVPIGQVNIYTRVQSRTVNKDDVIRTRKAPFVEYYLNVITIYS